LFDSRVNRVRASSILDGSWGTQQVETRTKGTDWSRKIKIKAIKRTKMRRTTKRVSQVAHRFGLDLDPDDQCVVRDLPLRIEPERIVFLVGPSGSGKTTALESVARECPGGASVDRMRFDGSRAIVDVICPHRPLSVALGVLGACGLSEARLWTRSYHELSSGQKFRARLARAIGRHITASTRAPIICDEFGSGLHRRLSRAVAFNLRKLVTRFKLSLVLASCDDDVAGDLQPDQLVRMHRPGVHDSETRFAGRRLMSLTRRLVIERGCKQDYSAFAAMHYRATDELGFVDKVFVTRDRAGGEPLGIVVYSHGPLELSLRNQATNNRFCRNPKRLNREVRIIRRLVVHPDIRGCGLGHRLVTKTMPMIGMRFVECLASMGEFNPVFERADMTRVGTCPMPKGRRRAMSDLERMGVDPMQRDFVMQVCRRRALRKVVARTVYEWYQATTGEGEKRVARQSPQFLAETFRGLIGCQPVYYLWERPVVAKKTRGAR
jgi:ABC-type lipoprotein export system ATPase subunit/GNAT superfamily N-acetyltransferase